jgi:hypothetical protein
VGWGVGGVCTKRKKSCSAEYYSISYIGGDSPGFGLGICISAGRSWGTEFAGRSWGTEFAGRSWDTESAGRSWDTESAGRSWDPESNCPEGGDTSSVPGAFSPFGSLRDATLARDLALRRESPLWRESLPRLRELLRSPSPVPSPRSREGPRTRDAPLLREPRDGVRMRGLAFWEGLIKESRSRMPGF